MITFPVSSVEPADHPFSYKTAQQPIQLFRKDLKEVGVEACNLNNGNTYYNRMNGFAGAFQEAYDSHRPLVLSPDDVWVTICHGFAVHVELNVEKLRSLFVDFDGKKMLMIQRDNFVKGSPTNDWAGCFAEWGDQIEQNIGSKTRNMLTSNFSTTGIVEKAASDVVLMGAMKGYFEYGMTTCCGIPSVTLTGTPEDWQSVYDRAVALSDYDVDWWMKELLPVLHEFVEASKGQADKAFWQASYKVSGGSGGPFVSGWISSFFPYLFQSYDKKNPYHKNTQLHFEMGSMTRSFGGIKTDQFLPGLTRVPMKWFYHNSMIEMEILGGFVGVSHDSFLAPPTKYDNLGPEFRERLGVNDKQVYRMMVVNGEKGIDGLPIGYCRPSMGWAISDPSVKVENPSSR